MNEDAIVDTIIDTLRLEIKELPSNNLYEQILETLHSIQRELVIIDNRLARIEDKQKAINTLETNRHLRLYGMKREGPIRFNPTH